MEKLEDGLIVVSTRSLGRVCQDAETREVLARVEKQVTLKLFILALLSKNYLDLYISLDGVSLLYSPTFHFIFLQVAVLSQSTGRVASSSEQYGAVQQEARVATAIEVTFSFLFSFLRFVFVPGHAAPRGQPEKELREGAHRARGDQEGPHRTQAACGENFYLLCLFFPSSSTTCLW